MICFPRRHKWEPRQYGEVRYSWGGRPTGNGTRVTFVCSRCKKLKVKDYAALLSESVIKEMRP